MSETLKIRPRVTYLKWTSDNEYSTFCLLNTTKDGEKVEVCIRKKGEQSFYVWMTKEKFWEWLGEGEILEVVPVEHPIEVPKQRRCVHCGEYLQFKADRGWVHPEGGLHMQKCLSCGWKGAPHPPAIVCPNCGARRICIDHTAQEEGKDGAPKAEGF
ncbi:hypothetical protein DRJ17_07670 [Candidatus Woesearchaeota archaeon]|nr:MAG: hypothetical protein DRJ17_07670 [Candidatus Woesearchaeota archaeon]